MLKFPSAMHPMPRLQAYRCLMVCIFSLAVMLAAAIAQAQPRFYVGSTQIPLEIKGLRDLWVNNQAVFVPHSQSPVNFSSYNQQKNTHQGISAGISAPLTGQHQSLWEIHYTKVSTVKTYLFNSGYGYRFELGAKKRWEITPMLAIGWALVNVSENLNSKIYYLDEHQSLLSWQDNARVSIDISGIATSSVLLLESAGSRTGFYLRLAYQSAKLDRVRMEIDGRSVNGPSYRRYFDLDTNGNSIIDISEASANINPAEGISASLSGFTSAAGIRIAF